ncbi:hypothetical protein [Aeromonas veronii]|uniref:hypothetical protein n=1 Tax=Aeromonas veronii TaxID=654 RepID=UPI000DE5B0B9|nr:hypothetical protein [Aeromonas veronii]
MKDSHDKLTADLLPTLRPRGRPSTGKASSNAERQAKHRAKRALLAENVVTVTIKKTDVGAIKLALAHLDFDPNLTDEQREAVARLESELYRVASGLSSRTTGA